MNELDLHGVKHEDVQGDVSRFINANWSGGEDVQVITGHSGKMKMLVMEVCQEYSIAVQFDICSPSLTICLGEV
jgi:hypothetical protein